MHLKAHAHCMPCHPLRVGDENLAKVVSEGSAQRCHFCACASSVARTSESFVADIKQARGQLAAPDAVDRFNLTEEQLKLFGRVLDTNG